MPLLPFQYNFHRSLIGHLSLEYSTNAEVIEFVIYADLDLDWAIQMNPNANNTRVEKLGAAVYIFWAGYSSSGMVQAKMYR